MYIYLQKVDECEMIPWIQFKNKNMIDTGFTPSVNIDAE